MSVAHANNRVPYLVNGYFIIGLVVLLLNDHWFKWTYPSWFTGKLSDFAGLFILPMLLSFLVPKHSIVHILASLLFFVWWKSELSENFIDWYNTWAMIPITRTLDYTDLWALSILPISWTAIQMLEERKAPKNQSSIKAIFLLSISTFALMATSPPKSFYYHHSTGNVSCWDCRININLDPKDLLSCLKKNGLEPKRDSVSTTEPFGLGAYWETSSSPEQPWPFYTIEKIILDTDTLRHVQIALEPLGSQKTRLHLNGAHIPLKSDSSITSGVLRKRYVRQLSDLYLKCINQ